MNFLKTTRWVLPPYFLLVLLLNPAAAQVKPGSSFLKIVPGARSQGMSGVLTGTLDEMHALYANPAATGFLREWQWATSYTEWFADTYILGLNYARQVRTPWSRHTRVALGVNYHGIRAFDSTGDLQPVASANDMLVTASVGNPVSFLSRNLSVGANLKYFRSELDAFSASSWIVDLGALLRSKRLKLGHSFFDYAIFSGGLSVTNLGSALTFINSETPLPRTFQIGGAVTVGSHRGLQAQLAVDLKKVRGESLKLSIGSELSWSYRVALRGGYNFDDDQLSTLSFGLSFRLDDHDSPLQKLPGRNNAMRIDIAGLEDNEIFTTTYQASVNHYPIAPERFDFISPLSEANIPGKEVDFAWTASPDPDLFDEVAYKFLVLRVVRDDTLTLARMSLLSNAATPNQTPLERIEEIAANLFLVREISFDRDNGSTIVHHREYDLPPGEYYWTVAARDLDGHVRFIGDDDSALGHFTILPDLYITGLKFEHSPVITDSDYQGDIIVTISNKGEAPAPPATLAIYDAAEIRTNGQAPQAANGHNGQALTGTMIKFWETVELPAGRDTTLRFEWRTTVPGLHNLTATVDPDDIIQEIDESNNDHADSFFTIPHGVFQTDAEVTTLVDSLYEYELPFIPKVYFEENSARIKTLQSSLLYEPLATLAQRLKVRENIHLRLTGHADLENNESASLALQRARAVKSSLVALGIDSSNINIGRPSSKKRVGARWRRTEDDLDNKWVKEENRFVKISAFRPLNKNREEVSLFYSVPVVLPKSKTYQPVEFISTITGAVPLAHGTVTIYSDTVQQQLFDFSYTQPDSNTLLWQLDEQQRNILQGKTVNYRVSMHDIHGREFETAPRSLLLKTQKTNLLPQKIIIGVAEFRKERPESNLYWANVADRLRHRLKTEDLASLNFVGHACAIGDSLYNADLSLARAQNFKREFKKRYPDLFNSALQQLEQIGIYGEGEDKSFKMEVDRTLFLDALRKHNFEEFKRVTYELVAAKKHNPNFPFTFSLQGNQIIIESDNRTPFGRQINRRIEIFLDPRDKPPRLTQNRR